MSGKYHSSVMNSSHAGGILSYHTAAATMRRNSLRRLLAAVLLCACAVSARAAFPAYLDYQGKLGNASGNPLTGIYSFRFQLCAQSSGACAFTEDVTGAANALSVTNGFYSVQIGSYTAGGIPAAVFSGPETWLEISIAAGTDINTGRELLSSRERLTASAFAFRALSAEGLGVGVNVATFTSAGNLQLVSGSTITSNGTLTISTAASAALTGAPALFINQTGGIGIGTASPASRLHVLDGDIRVSTSAGQASRGIIFQDGSVQLTAGAGGGETNTYTSSKTFTSAVDVGGGTILRSSLTMIVPVSEAYALVMATGSAAGQQILRVSTAGVLYAKAGVTYAGDLAESYPALDAAEAGEVVMLASDSSGPGGAAVRRAVAGRGAVLGVVSTQPGMTLGEGDMGRRGRRVPVALSGRVPVKVSLENGPVRAGAVLAAASAPGRSAVAVRSGAVIGLALEDARLGADGQWSVLCYVNVHDWVAPSELEWLKREVRRLREGRESP